MTIFNLHPRKYIDRKRKVIRSRLLLTINKKLQIGCQMSVLVASMTLAILKFTMRVSLLGAFMHIQLLRAYFCVS